MSLDKDGKYRVVTEVITHRVITVEVPPAIVGLNEYDMSPNYPINPEVLTGGVSIVTQEGNK